MTNRNFKKNKKTWFAKEKKADFYLLYTLAFIGISLFLFYYFFANGKSLVWSHDGIPQHINSLAYYGRYLRKLLKTLFVDHQLSMPMWDMNIGYGSDILTTLHYYVIGDPLTVLSVFVPEKNTEILYEILIFLRIYLAGISFSLYCFYHKNPKQATFLGTLIYIFAGWTIYASMKHPYFSNPMIYLPLILMGIDKIYKKEKPHLFIWATAIAALSNFYFFYMICIFMVLYAAFRYFNYFSKRSVKDVLVWLLKFAGYSILALMMAAVIFSPVIMTMFGTDRFQAQNYVPFLYDRIYYEKYLGCLIGENMIQWGVAGYSAVSMAGVFVVFSRRKKDLQLKLGFLLLNLFLLIPYAGHVLNGFSYVSNRWIWAYGMLIAYMFVKAYPELFTLSITEKRRVFVMLLVYCVLALYTQAARTQRNIMAVVLLTLSVLTVVSFGNIFVQGKYLCGMLAVLLVTSIALNVSYQYSYEKDYLSEFAGTGEAVEKLETGADQVVLDTGDTGIYRYDQFGSLPCDNTSMFMGTNSTAYYFSLANSSISNFFSELYLNTPWEQQYENLDGRTILDRLAAVKYFVVSGDDYAYLPYGYNTQVSENTKGKKEFRAYTGDNILPLGYTYDSYIPRSDYEKMTVTQKQQALLQGIVVEDMNAAGYSKELIYELPEAEMKFTDVNVDYEFLPGDGCQLKDGKIVVTQEGAQMKLLLHGEKDSETYFIAENLDYESLSPLELVSDSKWNKMSVYDQNVLLDQDSQWRYWKESKEASLTVSAGTVEKNIKIFTDKYNAYSGKHNFLCNLGYGKTGCNTITLTFANTGIYSYDKLQVSCQPMTGIEQETKARGEEALQNVVVGDNEITGDITVSGTKALLLSIPYSTGFKAYVDGQETELVQANTMYMALGLTEGSHQIRLVYCTPYFKIGALLSLLGLLGYAALCVVQKRFRSRANGE